MESIFSWLFGVIGVTSILVHNRSRQDLGNFLELLFSLAVLVMSGTRLESESTSSMLTLILVISLTAGFVLSRLVKLQSSVWLLIIPAAISFFPILLGEKVFTYYSFDLNFRSSLIVLFPLGVVLPTIGSKVSGLLKNWPDEQEDLSKSVSLLIMGSGTFVGFFLGSYYGVLLFASGVILASFYGFPAIRNVAFGLLFISLLPVFQESGGIEIIDLSLGETIAAIFYGASVVYLLHWYYRSGSTNLGLLLALAFGVLFLTGLLFMGTQKADLGGADAFIASFVGVAAALALLPDFRLAEALVPTLVAIALLLLPLTVPIGYEQDTMDLKTGIGSKKNKEKPTLFEGDNLPLDSIIGEYTINERTVQLNFQLGPKGGITTGGFKSFKGKISINKDLVNSIFSIELPFAQLTTFNKYRDESLAEEGYFNAVKYPLMTFVSKKLSKKNGHYELEGVFTMLGVTKPLKVELKYTGKMGSEKYPVLVGRSAIDRTEFGMKADSKEGNIVDFAFRVELIK
ncbi:MAG: YceI family protein [Flavobacteriia bacterium]